MEENSIQASTLLAGAAIIVFIGHVIWAALEYKSGVNINDCLYTVGRGLVISFGISLLSGLAMYVNKKFKEED
ncbi:hypothetical protein [Poseidonibacter ostreae]|jgi:hypothetical protein|uniref:Uncharacterized protein n=1 Tax=Poseidonibacter ostreae TaxID=2654171 RepID=A0A6L4WWF6_9BACT|nr:hypothetical protein [Poseidonibacter ostreae]KAB7888013.1 hypothetical protein GA417_01230 [Poseidonibacter ostreae]KAB7891068.1 hypothetical protein GBG19_01505 [Poseidonibacter ostreae]KAB7892792.1 hypothetical protein GBG18_01215 [Poseidonibacter ostreae]MAD40769.1 hypothetical protein [Arcobacter sp.]|tara:strand:- start:5874 stop:6092 length:219 start_codon:yes stop_codon:yes gene_type:complete